MTCRRPAHEGRSPATTILLCIVAAALCLAGAAPDYGRTLPSSTSDSEYRVKALFLYKMAHWIEWPKSNLPESAKEIVIGVVGKDPFGKELDLIEKLKPIKKRKVTTRRFESVGQVKDCQIIFLSDSIGEADRTTLIESARKKGIVTVSERKGFCAQGGMFSLIIVKNKLTFTANPSAAKKADIKVSSQLLKLAHRIVKEGE